MKTTLPVLLAVGMLTLGSACSDDSSKNIDPALCQPNCEAKCGTGGICLGFCSDATIDTKKCIAGAGSCAAIGKCAGTTIPDGTVGPTPDSTVGPEAGAKLDTGGSGGCKLAGASCTSQDTCEGLVCECNATGCEAGALAATLVCTEGKCPAAADVQEQCGMNCNACEGTKAITPQGCM